MKETAALPMILNTDKLLRGIKLLSQNKIDFINWSPPQTEFLKSNSRLKFLRAANQSGKTYVLVAECVYFALGTHPFKDERDVPQVPNEIIFVCASDDSRRNIVGKLFKELIPEHTLDQNNNFSSRGWMHNMITFKNGSKIKLVSSMSQTVSLAGATVDAIAFDEPPPKDLYGEALPRVAVKNGWVLLGFTPIASKTRELSWLKEIIESPKSKYHEIVAPLNHANAPHRTYQSILDQINNTPKLEYEQRINAGWDGVDPDRDFGSFTHLNVFNDELDIEGDIIVGIDWGELKGNQAMIFCAYNRQKEKLYVFDEYVSKSRNRVEEDARVLIEKLESYGVTPFECSKIVGDINSAGKQFGGLSYNDILSEIIKVKVSKAQKGQNSVDSGLRVLDFAFKYENLLIHERCKELIKTINTFKSGSKDDHIIDALRYAVSPIIKEIFNKKNKASKLIIGV